MKIFILLASGVCLLGLVQALPHPQDEELEGLEEDEDLVAGKHYCTYCHRWAPLF